MNDSAYVPRRRELTWPRLNPRDRPAAADIAEARRLANPHRPRAKPRTTTTTTTTTPKEETK